MRAKRDELVQRHTELDLELNDLVDTLVGYTDSCKSAAASLAAQQEDYDEANAYKPQNRKWLNVFTMGQSYYTYLKESKEWYEAFSPIVLEY